MRKLLSLFLICVLSSPAFPARSFTGTSSGGSAGNGATSNKNIFTGTPASVSIAFWMWENAFGSGDQLALESSANYSATNGAFNIDPNLSNDGTCTGGFFFAEKGAGGTRARKFTQPSAAVWHHYVFTMTSTSANWAAYVDGVSQSLTNCDISSPTTQTFVPAVLCVMSRGCSSSLSNAGKMAQLAIWQSVILSANEAVSLASCTEPWQIQPESLTYYAPMYGVDSPEPSYSVIGVTIGPTNSMVLANSSFTPGPPQCPGIK